MNSVVLLDYALQAAVRAKRGAEFEERYRFYRQTFSVRGAVLLALDDVGLVDRGWKREVCH